MAELVSAGDFTTEGERKAAAELRKLPAGWVVIANKTLPRQDGSSYELDFVVVADRWVFYLDEKSWRGKIRGNNQSWIRADGSSTPSPLGKADYVAKVLAGHIRAKIPQLNEQHTGGHFVRGGVLLSAADQLPDLHDEPRAKEDIFLLSTVCDRLRTLDGTGGTPLVAHLRPHITRCLADFSNRLTIPERIGEYHVEDIAVKRPGVRVVQATLEDGGERTLMVYDLGKDPLAAADLREFYRREFKALAALRETGLAPVVKDPFDWSDDFLVLPIEPLPGKSLRSYPLPQKTREGLYGELLLAAACFRGLVTIHEKGVVHRALDPDVIHVLSGGSKPKVAFTEFYAARVGTHSIAVRLDEFAREDPYAAPELALSYTQATPASDSFSLALIFLERITGTSIDVLRQANGAVSVPAFASAWPEQTPADLMMDVEEVFRGALISDIEKRLSASGVAEFLEEYARRLRVEINVEEKAVLEGGRFEVQDILGRGTTACTYLAIDRNTDDLCALKQFYRSADVTDYARAEWNALKDAKTPHLPNIYEVFGANSDVHVKMEYIPGPTLQDLSREFPWPPERWRAFAQGMMDALGTLERKNLLHRDIKPSNIILDERTGEPVLIDFGFAISRGRATGAAGTFSYLPPEALNAETPPQSSDRYALALVLYQVLTGRHPSTLTEPAVQAEETSLSAASAEEETRRRIIAVLRRAASPREQERPKSVAELREGIETALRAIHEPLAERALPARVNPWVDEMRGLYRNSTIGNANNRGLDTDFVRETYVPTALDTVLLPALLQQHPRALFLSGNPGDGKTAFLEQVRADLERNGATHITRDPSGWEYTYQGHTFRSCYDASEAHDGASADAQLSAKLRGLEGDTPPADALTVLVAINDGRLDDFFARHSDVFGWLAKQIRLRRLRGREPMLSTPVWVVNLTRRSFVSFPGAHDRSIYQRVLATLVTPEKWTVCEGCAARTSCPIRGNAQALRDAEVSGRLEYLLLLMHLRRQRHTTMRDLRSALAYLITADTGCADVHKARAGDDTGASLIDRAYYQLVFAAQDTGDELFGDLAQLDPARLPQPRLDRFLHFHQSVEDAWQRAVLYHDGQDLAPQRITGEREWIAAVKRRLFFKASEDALSGDIRIRWQALAPYQYSTDFLEALAGRASMGRLRERLALGILRSDDVLDQAPSGYLGVKVNASAEQQLIVLKRFPIEKFVMLPPRSSDDQLVETINEVLIFKHVSGTPRLEITLDLFELLMRLADGLRPDAPELKPLLEDLVPFKNALLLSETKELVLIESQRREHIVTQRDGKVVRLPEGEWSR